MTHTLKSLNEALDQGRIDLSSAKTPKEIIALCEHMTELSTSREKVYKRIKDKIESLDNDIRDNSRNERFHGCESIEQLTGRMLFKVLVKE